MKNILLILISIFFLSCEKDDSAAKESRVFKVEAAGTKYDFKFTKRATGTDKESVIETCTSCSGNYEYEYRAVAGETYKVTLSGAGLTSWKISYKGQELMYSVAPGSGINQDFPITE